MQTPSIRAAPIKAGAENRLIPKLNGASAADQNMAKTSGSAALIAVMLRLTASLKYQTPRGPHV